VDKSLISKYILKHYVRTIVLEIYWPVPANANDLPPRNGSGMALYSFCHYG
jgi:hypothetical protein